MTRCAPFQSEPCRACTWSQSLLSLSLFFSLFPSLVARCCSVSGRIVGGIDGSFGLATRQSQSLKAKAHKPWRCLSALDKVARRQPWGRICRPRSLQRRTGCKRVPVNVPLRHWRQRCPVLSDGRCFVRRPPRIGDGALCPFAPGRSATHVPSRQFCPITAGSRT